MLETVLKKHEEGDVYTSSWLKSQGINTRLQHYYRKTKKLQYLGDKLKMSELNMIFPADIDLMKYRVLTKYSEAPKTEGIIKAIQYQMQLNIHIGADHALQRLGYRIAYPLRPFRMVLFGNGNQRLPKWVSLNSTGCSDIIYKKTSFLPQNVEILKLNGLMTSSPLRAIFELIYLVPNYVYSTEAFDYMKLLTDLNAKSVQHMLENCESYRVKRIFLFLAEKAGHQWFGDLCFDRIDLGKGTRLIELPGIHEPKYKIIISPILINKTA
ncbi:MAG: type IV toxin-antitoxin system AbiEi family antitoxin domain-containing protein [Flavobacteriaceae bacterium]|nr:type IV toxin-antitoxin system AbiEi family antitoxin domain-containing protein [Flavobacteriaceae bacterium]MCY4266713.1 type IV toxin-antitoxin system AbiEi family antitoxin domain-containing protein [Flavobacteriaceae bacterium]MCY4297725.1 type IV toxin-antitoxin system AbiEi family antitoxin domain-containing protein [Flavobacteriaceae bacterium]